MCTIFWSKNVKERDQSKLGDIHGSLEKVIFLGGGEVGEFMFLLKLMCEYLILIKLIK